MGGKEPKEGRENDSRTIRVGALATDEPLCLLHVLLRLYADSLGCAQGAEEEGRR